MKCKICGTEKEKEIGKVCAVDVCYDCYISENVDTIKKITDLIGKNTK